MSYAEFPHTNMFENDRGHHELIKFYLEVRDKYQGTLDMITKVSDELDEYRRTMNSEITKQVNISVANAVASSLSNIQDQIDSVVRDIVSINKLITNIQESTDSEINAIKSSIDELRIECEAKALELNNSIRQLATNLQNQISSLESKMLQEDQKTLAEAEGYALRLNTSTVSNLSSKIDALEATASAEAIRWLWEYGCCAGGFTAEEWYHLTNITCECWNKVQPMAWDWYTMGRRIFKRFTDHMKMFSPVSGRYVDVRVALLELAAKFNIGNLSAEEYSSLEITAEEYDKVNANAGEYDWHGKELFYAQQED